MRGGNFPPQKQKLKNCQIYDFALALGRSPQKVINNEIENCNLVDDIFFTAVTVAPVLVDEVAIVALFVLGI